MSKSIRIIAVLVALAFAGTASAAPTTHHKAKPAAKSVHHKSTGKKHAGKKHSGKTVSHKKTTHKKSNHKKA